MILQCTNTLNCVDSTILIPTQPKKILETPPQNAQWIRCSNMFTQGIIIVKEKINTKLTIFSSLIMELKADCCERNFKHTSKQAAFTNKWEGLWGVILSCKDICNITLLAMGLVPECYQTKQANKNYFMFTMMNTKYLKELQSINQKN